MCRERERKYGKTSNLVNLAEEYVGVYCTSLNFYLFIYFKQEFF